MEVPVRNLVGRQVTDPVLRVPLRHLQELRGVGQRIHLAVTVQRPCQAARPGTFRTQTLVRGLTQELARLGIEDAFMSD